MKKKYINIVCITLIISFFVHLFTISSENIDTHIFDVYEGHFFSSDGEQLTKQVDDKHIARLTYSEEYSPLIGYATVDSVSNLRAKYEDYLWKYEKHGKVDSHGCDIVLTIDHGIQSDVYRIVKSLNANSSAVVLENNTGKILALVSTKENFTFDANNIASQYTEGIPDGGLIPEWKISTAPGSTFKIISSIPVIEQAHDNEFYTDKGIISAKGTTIHNYGSYSYGAVDLQKALIHSSNCYFVNQYSTNLGKSDLNDIANRLFIGEQLDLDFASISSNFDITGESFNLLQSCFGQGKTLITPVQMAMIMSCIRTGEITKPYLVQSIGNAKKAFITGKTEVISENTIDKHVREKLISYLKTTGESYGLRDGIAAKSGTAEVGKGTVCWMVTSSEQYTVVLRTNKPKIMGVNLTSYISDIYSVLD